MEYAKKLNYNTLANTYFMQTSQLTPTDISFRFMNISILIFTIQERTFFQCGHEERATKSANRGRTKKAKKKKRYLPEGGGGEGKS